MKFLSFIFRLLFQPRKTQDRLEQYNFWVEQCHKNYAAAMEANDRGDYDGFRFYAKAHRTSYERFKKEQKAIGFTKS